MNTSRWIPEYGLGPLIHPLDFVQDEEGLTADRVYRVRRRVALQAPGVMAARALIYELLQTCLAIGDCPARELLAWYAQRGWAPP